MNHKSEILTKSLKIVTKTTLHTEPMHLAVIMQTMFQA